MSEALESIQRAYAQRLAEDVDKFVLGMILRGLFPSQGWRCAVQHLISEDGRVLQYRLTAVRP